MLHEEGTHHQAVLAPNPVCEQDPALNSWFVYPSTARSAPANVLLWLAGLPWDRRVLRGADLPRGRG